MLNILGKLEKKKILIEYYLRLAIVTVVAIGALLFSSLVLFVPSYILAVSKYNDAQSDLTTLKEKALRSEKENELNVKVIATNKNIDLYLKGNVVNTSAPSSIIKKITAIKGSAIKISEFTYDPGAKERIVITGTALNRESLAAFIEVLKKEPTFTSVEVPISVYVKSTDISFSAVITRELKK